MSGRAEKARRREAAEHAMCCSGHPLEHTRLDPNTPELEREFIVFETLQREKAARDAARHTQLQQRWPGYEFCAPSSARD